MLMSANFALLLFLCISINSYSQNSGIERRRVRYTKEQMDSIAEVRRQYYIKMARIRISDLEANTQKDTLKSVSIAGSYLEKVPDFIKECVNLTSLYLGDIYRH